MMRTVLGKTAILALLIAVAFAFTLGTAYAGSAPAKVKGVKIKTAKSTAILTWKKAARAKGYQVYRAKDGSAFKKIGTVKKASKKKFTDKNLKPGIEYSYKVRAYNGKKTGKFSRVVKAKIDMEDIILNPPARFRAEVEDNKVILTWERPGGSEYINLYRNGGSLREYVETQRFIDDNVEYNHDYTYEAEAVYYDGGLIKTSRKVRYKVHVGGPDD